MKKVVIFGAGNLGQYLYEKMKHRFDILFFVDNASSPPSAQLPVLRPSTLKDVEFDLVYIACANGLNDIYAQLLSDIGVPKAKINKVWSEAHHDHLHTASRVRFLEDFSEFCYSRDMEGNCAEVGVYKGTFAAEINRVFSDKRLYLFDTFQGFDARDLIIERTVNDNYAAIETWVESGIMAFKETSVDAVVRLLPHPEQAIIKRGFFPKTFDLNHDERFVFVNLDTDLYQPIRDGLEIFYPLMARGGVILVHDYYSMLSGVTKAVDEFTDKHRITTLPIGDYRSIAIIKS